MCHTLSDLCLIEKVINLSKTSDTENLNIALGEKKYSLKKDRGDKYVNNILHTS